MSCYLCFSLILFRIFILYLLFKLWNYVEHNRQFFYLDPSCFFPLTLILCTLSNLLYFCSFRLESLKGYINNGLTHCIKTFVVAMEVNNMGCVLQDKTFFHRICNNIEFIKTLKKVRSTKVLCYIYFPV